MATILGTVNLNGCNYQLGYDLLSQDVAGNSSKVRFYGILNVTNNYISWTRGTASAHTHSASIGTRYNKGQHILVTADFTLAHNDEGKFENVWIGASLSTTFVSGSTGGYLTLPTIARKSSVSEVAGVINKNTQVTIHSASNSFHHNLTYFFGNTNGVIGTGLGGGTHNWAIPNELYAQIPNAREGNGYIQCDTYSGGTYIGSTTAYLHLYADESECRPNISISAEDINSKTLALTGNKNKFIRERSNAKIVVNTTAKNWATITRTSASCADGQAFNGSSGTIQKVRSATFTGYVTDSRGYSNSATIIKDIIDYIPLTLNARLYRPNETGTELKLAIEGNFFNGSFGSVNNALTLKYRLKKDDGTWNPYNNISPTISTGIYSAEVSLGSNFDYRKSYEVQIECSDKLDTLDTRTVKIAEGIPMMALFKDHIEMLGQKVYVGYVLFDKPSGEAGAVKLSDNIGKYDYIDIYYSISDNISLKNGKRLYDTNGGYFFLDSTEYNENQNRMFLSEKRYDVNNAYLTPSSEGQHIIAFEGNACSMQVYANIVITRVIGWK